MTVIWSAARYVVVGWRMAQHPRVASTGGTAKESKGAVDQLRSSWLRPSSSIQLVQSRAVILIVFPVAYLPVGIRLFLCNSLQMAAEIHQQLASGIYDQTQLKAMSMWNFEQYGMPKDEKMFNKQEMMQFPMFAPQLSGLGVGGSARDSPGVSKKKPQPVPEEQKDESYRERRRRNNEAARKSREQRRWKEEATSKRLEVFQQENFRLRQEVHRLHAEIQELRYMMTAVNNMASMNMGQGANWPANGDTKPFT